MSSPLSLFPATVGSSRLERLLMLGLAAAVFAVYGQTLGFGFIPLDDPGYVYNNPHVRAGLTWDGLGWAFTTFRQANWHPLTWLSLMLDAQFFGLHAGGYHLTNLLLHTLDTLLLFRWLRVATGALWPSAVVAFLFAVHPLHVESVAWVTERKDVLSTAFFFLNLLAYTRYTRETGPGRTRPYFLALGFFALGLTAKPMLVTLPPLLVLLDYWPLQRFEPGMPREHWRQLGRLLREKIPFGILMAASCAVTYIAQHNGAVVAIKSLPASFRLATAVLGTGTYLQKTFWPTGLSVFYPYWSGVSMWWPVGWAVALASLTAAALWQWRRRPYLTVGWLWFLGMLVPVIGLVQVGSQAVADRYTYLPHVGLFVALCWAGQEAWRHRPRARVWINVVAVGAMTACLAAGAWQAHFWRDGVTLFAHSIEVLPGTSSRVLQLYAVALADSGRQAEAAAAYEQAWQSNPHANNHEAAEFMSRFWLKSSRAPDVVNLLEPLARERDASADTLGLLAEADARGGRADEAMALYRRCTERYPDEALAHFALADMLRARGDVEAACGEYEAGLVHQDTSVPVLTYLAWTYSHLDDPDAHERALLLARRAVDLGRSRDPGGLEALAAAEASNGQWPQAVEAAQAAVKLTESGNASPAVAESCRQRLASYQQGKLP